VRVLVVAGALLALAACSGGDSGTADSPTSALRVASTTAPVTAAATTTIPVATTVAPATPPPTVTSVPTSPAPVAGPVEYAAVAAPRFPTRSAPPPEGDGLPDGAYYAVVDGAGIDPAPYVDVTIYQLVTGPEALDAAAADGEGLDSDIYVRPAPAVPRRVPLPAVLSVARPDRPDVSYGVSAGELVRLVVGAPPTGAPSGYRYLPFPYLVTVAGGVPVSVEQLWSP
jgi:hypothetical protein